MKNLFVITLSLVMIGLTGCATSRGLVTLNAPQHVNQSETLKHTAVIKIVEDDRHFENRPTSPSIPSLKGGLNNATEEEKARAIARKRNTYGKALGDILLREGTVSSVVQDRVISALNQAGYKVIPTSVENERKADLVVSVQINKFWSWSNLGVLSTEIETTLVNDKNTAKNIVVDTKLVRPVHVKTGQQWVENINLALDEYETKLAKELKSK
ncbi:flagellar biosynthesis protein [Acinetobacter equi]|nr:flagellar biosynthesis protein [Acinetobacter equi]